MRQTEPSMAQGYCILALLVAGSVLRLLWPADMEWKGDEQWMFAHAVAYARHGVLPWIGMPSGAGVVNPGFSIWPFTGFALWGAQTPIAMVQWVQGLNVIALWGWAAFAWYAAPPRSRTTWLWGVALFAVSPLPVLFARKLWAQDLFPVLGMPLLWAYHYRRRAAAAFAWGVLGALIGQLHMSGFFFAFGLLVATLVLPTARRETPATAWYAWLAGSVCGALPLLPWAVHLLHPGGHSVVADVRQLLTLRFYAGWLLNAWGVGLAYSMKSFFWTRFLAAPVIAGHATYGMAVAHVALVAAALYAMGRWGFRRTRLPNDPTLDALLLAAGVIAGGAITLSLLKIRPHYLIVFAPLLQVWAAALLRDRPRVLASVVALQLAVSATFLGVVHARGGIPEGDYGVTYRAQGEPLGVDARPRD